MIEGLGLGLMGQVLVLFLLVRYHIYFLNFLYICNPRRCKEFCSDGRCCIFSAKIQQLGSRH